MDDTLSDLQSLSSAGAGLCLSVERFLLQDLRIQRGARFVMGVSGGADSTSLAVVMRILMQRNAFELSALTVNHRLRRDSAQDAESVLAFCKRLNIDCALRETDAADFAAQNRLGLEEAGRTMRYAFFEQERCAQKADFIALGHHTGDLTEDVLLRLIRGTGWPALGGMPAYDGARRLVRPLLFSKPAALKALLRECGVAWREDASNASLRFRRNRLRHTVLPLLRKENPALDRTVAGLWRLAQRDRDFWDTHLANALAVHPWQETSNGLILPKELLRVLHPAARLRLYHKCVRRLGTGQARAETLLALDAAWVENRGNTRFQLPGALEAKLAGGAVCFKSPSVM
ncbi:MAG: tRNA(Ile)-lysidine synthetase [Candidatus Desulfovibrio kirbyi]|uniref:tRNA(Ile)-lysidine synthase n=1 Tax=Candidatus Desulfovibrio kirbyi TaxID=2696086 RepID=A0A6L2R584_9BACT|nr:MAG: tRNA(Ile)-lysidine synthetase [Candidatus Desulfovibrio kirbyi]